MESGSRSPVEEAIVRLERQNWNMRAAIALLAVLWMGMAGWLGMRGSTIVQAAPPAPDSILRTHAVVITDANGVDRLWIGAPLPNPAVFGKRYKRSVEISGVLLLDPDGNERGGYVTDDRGDAFLSLDTIGDEVGDFTAHAGGGVTLQLRDGSAQLNLAADDSGPRLRLAHDNQTVFEQPQAATEKEK